MQRHSPYLTFTTPKPRKRETRVNRRLDERNDAPRSLRFERYLGRNGWLCDLPMSIEFQAISFTSSERRNEKEKEKSHVRASTLRNREKNRPVANFDLYPDCWRPSLFYRTFNFTVSPLRNRIREARSLRAEKQHRDVGFLPYPLTANG